MTWQHDIAWALILAVVAAALAGLAWEAGLQDLARAWRRKRNITITVRTVRTGRQP